MTWILLEVCKPRPDQEVDLWAGAKRHTDCHLHCGEWLRWTYNGVDDEPAWKAVENPTHWQALPSAPDPEDDQVQRDVTVLLG